MEKINFDLEKIKKLLTGKVKNWKDLGGENLQVTVVLSKVATGTNSLVKKKWLEDFDFATDAIYVDTAAEVAKTVSIKNGSIGFVPARLADSQKVYVVPNIEIVRPIGVIVKGSSSQAINDLVKFLKSKG